MYDLTIFPLLLEAGREQYEVPGFLAASVPRKAARMRQQDQLILYWKVVTTSGSPASFTPTQQQEILTRLSETYYTTAGSVTAGLRAAMARLNDFLLRRNLKSAQQGQAIGMMTLAVLHGSTIYIANAGPVHIFILGKERVNHFTNDPASAGPVAGRGLGLSRTPAIRYHQAAIAPGDLLLVTPDAPPSWTEKTLAGSPQISFEHLRRRLLSEAGVELQAVVVRLQPGKGQVSRYQPPPERVQRPAASAAPTALAESTASAAPAAPAASDAAAEPATAPGRETETAVTASAPSVEGLPEVEDLTARSLPVEETLIPSTEALPAEEELPEPESSPTVALPAEEPPADGDHAGESEAEYVPAPNDILEQDTPPADTYPVQPDTAPEPEETIPEMEAWFLGQDIEPAEPAAETLSPRPPVESSGEPSGQVVPPETGKWHHAPRVKRAAAQPQAAPGEQAEAGGLSQARRRLNAMLRPGARPGRSSDLQPAAPEPTPAGPSPGEQLRLALASAWRKGSAARARSRAAFNGLTARLFPRRSEPIMNLSPAWMLLIALLVPLAVVTAATTVYFQAGRAEQFDALFLQAEHYAQVASQATDPAQKKAGWAQAYSLVLRAEAYGSSPESDALRRQALSLIDEMDGIVRLAYQPAVSTNLPAGVSVTRMAPTLNEVFLLDASEGRILRLARTTASNYDYDPAFVCGPGEAGDMVIGPLIDLVPLPINNELGANVMGIDAGGNLVYCKAGDITFASRTLTPPDQGWSRVTAITSYGDTLYVLDPGNNGVYYYNGSNGVYADPPHFYFGSAIPEMADVIDIAVDQEFLYLLHQNGRMTTCSSGGFAFAETRCTDPTPYGDARSGYDPAPLSFAGANFIQAQTTQPPDPSLFILDSANRSIFHLSLRKLNLQRQYRAYPEADFPLPDAPPTAFAITPNRRALLAFGSQVFFAPLP